MSDDDEFCFVDHAHKQQTQKSKLPVPQNASSSPLDDEEIVTVHHATTKDASVTAQPKCDDAAVQHDSSNHRSGASLLKTITARPTPLQASLQRALEDKKRVSESDLRDAIRRVDQDRANLQRMVEQQAREMADVHRLHQKAQEDVRNLRKAQQQQQQTAQATLGVASQIQSELFKARDQRAKLATELAEGRAQVAQIHQEYETVQSLVGAVRAELESVRSEKHEHVELLADLRRQYSCELEVLGAQNMSNNQQKQDQQGEPAEKQFRCDSCGMAISTESQVVDRSYQGMGTSAFLFRSARNIRLGVGKERHFTSGLHRAQDVFCAFCDTGLGWKYTAAFDKQNLPKVGKFCLSMKCLHTDSLKSA